jgi:indolepyruvate ferredoxin oxidoreductase beta subunit
MSGARPIKIAVMALGGQGGGVLAEWIVRAGERAGLIAQATSVPGVAQRTGATMYYLELFPRAAAEAKGKHPILALTPAPGDIDILIAAEMMEAGRALVRGFVSGRTTLIASTHRAYAIAEKIGLGDARQDAAAVRAAIDADAGRAIWFDMAAAADHSGAAISAVMLGALAASRAAPIAPEDFEATIRLSGRSVERNIKGFEAGFAAVADPAAVDIAGPAVAAPPSLLAESFARRVAALPAPVRDIAQEGVRRAADFQDERYAALYLARVERLAALDREKGGEAHLFRLASIAAKYLALWMCYEDVVRVADLKTRASRFSRLHRDVRAGDGQIVRVFEYLHPRVEEMCDLLPPRLAAAILRSPRARAVAAVFLGRGRRVPTTNIGGFLFLHFLAALRPLRRAGARFAAENDRIDGWLGLVAATATADYALAVELAGLPRLIKGYGETHARGLAHYEAIVGALAQIEAQAAPAAALARLKDAALKDEDGRALKLEFARLERANVKSGSAARPQSAAASADG